MSGAEMIAVERQRQIDAEGYTPNHDDHHDRGEITDAAIAYADVAEFIESTGRVDWSAYTRGISRRWPWQRAAFHPNERDAVPNLVKAGALIAAEIDRIERRSSPVLDPQEPKQ